MFFFTILRSYKLSGNGEAFVRCILDILNVMDLPVQDISTDRHTGKKIDENR